MWDRGAFGALAPSLDMFRWEPREILPFRFASIIAACAMRVAFSKCLGSLPSLKKAYGEFAGHLATSQLTPDQTERFARSRREQIRLFWQSNAAKPRQCDAG